MIATVRGSRDGIVAQSVKVTRPQREVFVLGANPTNDARRGSNLLEGSPGPLGVEDRFATRPALPAGGSNLYMR